MLSQADNTAGLAVRVSMLAVLVIILLGAVVGGLMAFTGRWRSWYPDRYRATFTPLAAPWFAGAALLMGALAGLNVLFDPMPRLVGVPGIALAMTWLVVAVVYAIHPPRAIRPRWIRYMDGDPVVSEPRRHSHASRGVASSNGIFLRNKVFRGRLTVAVLGVASLSGFVLLSQPLWWYVTGTSTTATVERCGQQRPSRGSLVCHGRWMLPDGHGQGKIVGPGRGDVGRQVTVRASRSHAAAFTARLVVGPAVILLLVAGTAYTGYRQWVRQNRPSG